MSDRRAELRVLSGLLTEPSRSRVRSALDGFALGRFDADPFAEVARRRPELLRLVVLAAADAAEWKLGGSVAIETRGPRGAIVRVYAEPACASVALGPRGLGGRVGIFVAWPSEAARRVEALTEALRVFVRTLEDFLGAGVEMRDAA